MPRRERIGTLVPEPAGRTAGIAFEEGDIFALRASLATSAMVLTAVSGVIAPPSAATAAGNVGPGGQWEASRGRMPVVGFDTIGVKIDDHRVMWLGESSSNHADNNRTFIHDVNRQTFREAAPLPAVKVAGQGLDEGNSPLWLSSVGVRSDGSVVVAGGAPGVTAQRDAATRLSYRYGLAQNRWNRTGDLPEIQGWVGTPMLRLSDGRLLIAGGTKIGSPPGRFASMPCPTSPRARYPPRAPDNYFLHHTYPT